MTKIAFIGAGSLGFTRSLVKDILTFPRLQDATLALMDIDAERLEFARESVGAIVKKGRYPARIVATMDRAEALAQSISRSAKDVGALKLDEANLVQALEKVDVLVNATSVGMSPDAGETPVPAGLLKSGLVVFDIVYNPLKTRLLKEAEAAGARTVSGLDMLVWQGALAFEKWTGQQAPLDLMRKEAIKALGK